jgi:sialate O-acetylesterase
MVRLQLLRVAMLLVSLVYFSIPAVAVADVRLAALFSDHAVLQRDRPLPVWGWAEPGEEVRVRLNAESAVTTAGPDGRWQVTLKAQVASKVPTIFAQPICRTFAISASTCISRQLRKKS